METPASRPAASGLSLTYAILLQTATILIPLAARGLQVEDKVLHVKPQLADRLLHQIQNTAATLRTLEDSGYDRC